MLLWWIISWMCKMRSPAYSTLEGARVATVNRTRSTRKQVTYTKWLRAIDKLRNAGTYGKSLVFKSIANVLSFVTNSISTVASVVQRGWNQNGVTRVADSTRMRRYFEHTLLTDHNIADTCNCTLWKKRTFPTSIVVILPCKRSNKAILRLTYGNNSVPTIKTTASWHWCAYSVILTYSAGWWPV